MATSYALHASATFHGRVVEETFVRSGEAVQIGNTPRFVIPVPEDQAWIARVVWTGPSSCAVQDAAGGMHVLEYGRDVILETGAVHLRLSVIRRVRHAWLDPLSFRGSLAWFAVVLMSSVLTMQAVWVEQNPCLIAFSVLPGVEDVGLPVLWAVGLGLAFAGALGAVVLSLDTRRAWRLAPLALAPLLVPFGYTATGSTWMSGDQLLAEEFQFCLGDTPRPGGYSVDAEYLARLLRKDYEGDETGVIEDRIDRPSAEKSAGRAFLPAGNLGPITKMGGAEDTARRPIRTVEEQSRIRPKRKERELPLVAAEGAPVEKSAEEDSQDGAADALDVKTEDAKQESEAPAEEERGWGIPDWYDEEDQALDQLEIELMLHAAKRRLAIDPDDSAALSILSYYQYLAEDYGAALRTYDRFIELNPDEAAGYNNKALVYKRLGDYKKEEGLYREALAHEPLDETALNNLAVNLAHQGRYEEALAVMEQLETLDPDDPYADLHRSKIHAEMGHDEEALEYLEKALDGMDQLDTLHHIEFRQDIRIDPSFGKLRDSYRFRAILSRYYGKDSPLRE